MKETITPPVRCSSCFGQYPDRVHIDFEAWWDGPVVNEGEGDVPIKVPIDDLVLCDVCIRAAAKMVGMEEGTKLKKENDELGEAVEAKDKELKDKDKIITDLQFSLEYLRKHPVKSPGGRPTLVGVGEKNG